MLGACKLETFCYDAACPSGLLNGWKSSLKLLEIVTSDSFGSQIFPNVKSICIKSSSTANLVGLEAIFPAAARFYLDYTGPSDNWTNVHQIIHNIQVHRAEIEIACKKVIAYLWERLFGSVWSSGDQNEFRGKGVGDLKEVILLKKSMHGLLWSSFDMFSSEFTDLIWHHYNMDEFFVINA